MTVVGTCPACGLKDQFFGPAEVVWKDEDGAVVETTRYVNCKRCAAMLVLGRDGVEEVDHAVR